MSTAWRALADECARWHDLGRWVDFWWRDDDAAQRTPALERLLALADATQVPVALAVVPEGAEAALLAGSSAQVCVLQHGDDHRNRAAAGERKTEFSATEPIDAALARLARGRARLEALAGARSLSVLVPPWNRLSEDLIPHLAAAGFRGLSRYGARPGIEAAPGLRQINTQIDIIAWHAGRGFVGEDAALGLAVKHLGARRRGSVDANEATGWLTHHACHDAAAWRFLTRLFEVSRRLPGVRWVAASELFRDRVIA